MLKRKIESELIKWKSLPDHNPLVIKGCRQCGKTFSALHFANSHYESVVYINFFENNLYREIFAGTTSIDRITMELSAVIGRQNAFIPQKTCIILDEIQEVPAARTCLKFFKLDGRYDVIATGSLLGISGYKDQPVSIPVGYETVITMYPLDFEEFLWANGVSEDYMINLVSHMQTMTPFPESMLNFMYDQMLQYIVVGGMPAVVNSYISNHLLDIVLQLQRDILNGYRDDMVKCSPKPEKSKIRECFDSIPFQLAKENKKFQYSRIEKGGRASKFSGVIKWIEDAGIIQVCHNLRMPEFPLAGNAERDIFKIYMTDIGLLVAMLEDGAQFDILHNRLYTYKGAIVENLIADFFAKAGKKLYYFRKESGLEVDFVTRWKNEATLIECKSSDGNVKSIKTILSHPDKYHVEQAVKLCHKNIGQSNGLLTLPLFCGAFLFSIRNE